MCMCSCSSCSYGIILVCSVINQVIFTVLQTMDCDIGNHVLPLLWVQTVVAFASIIYLCVPGLRMLTKMLYLHLLPSLLLLALSLSLAYLFMHETTACTIMGNDVQPLLNAAYFCQGVVPILAFIVFSDDLNKSCRGTAKYKKMNALQRDEE